MKTINLAVNGTLMRDLKLNQNLLNVGAEFVKEAQTEPTYRLWSIDDKYPAMQRVNESGTNIDVEIWAVPLEGLAQILLQEPPGLCIGKVRLDSGEEVLGVVGETIACEGKKEITNYGGWRNYIQSMV
ncbi:gamma-glutamylcyclotransferase [Spirulina sp. 06S082]|uniref:allophanate hydrolase-related protein n=1 Tax=Spirulina sp. 06S082 TaxID=3110248 RepID=UPI002B21F22C|nr:gamma-glutamylcyclotransferase [Spirulina sp. 06S082]MEA5472444.1 gamma-glutamylcyclotransferase [Spirulina sp. 06S082]